MLYQIFFSPQVKQSVIISNKTGIHESSHELPNDCSYGGHLQPYQISMNKPRFLKKNILS